MPLQRLCPQAFTRFVVMKFDGQFLTTGRNLRFNLFRGDCAKE
jgi:hypothetical protein